MTSRPRGLAIRYLLFLLVALASLATVQATIVYDSWVLVGEVVEVADQLVHTAVDDSWEILAINSDEDNFIIRNGSCSSGKYYKYCYQGARWELDKYGEYDYTTLKKKPEVKFTIEDITPEVGISVTLDETTLAVNDVGRLTVKVDNEGIYKAYDLYFKLILPDELIPRSASKDVTIRGQEITWKANALNGAGGEEKFYFEFKVDEPVDTTLPSNFSYSYDEKIYDMVPSAPSITAQETVTLETVKLDPSSASIDEEVDLTVEVRNGDANYEARVSLLKIDVPNDIYIKDFDDDLKKEGRSLVWSGNLEAKENLTFEATFTAEYSGTYDFNVSVDAEAYSSLSHKYLPVTDDRITTLTINLKQLRPTMDFMLGRTTVDGGQGSNIRVYLENPDENIAYHNIEYTITSELFEDVSGTIDFLPRNYEKLMLFQEFIAPIADETKSYPVSFSGTYRTHNLERFSFETSASLTVNQEIFSELLALTHNLPAEIVENETVQVTLKAENMQDERFAGVAITDTIEGAEIISGATDTRIAVLSKGESRDAYTYRLRVPPGSNASSVIIRTEAEFLYRDQPFTVFTETAASITRPEIEETPPEMPDDDPEDDQPTDDGGEDPSDDPFAEEKEPGFFRKIINGISGFFERLFA